MRVPTVPRGTPLCQHSSFHSGTHEKHAVPESVISLTKLGTCTVQTSGTRRVETARLSPRELPHAETHSSFSHSPRESLHAEAHASFSQVALRAFETCDKECSGYLTWNNGEIRNFIAKTFMPPEDLLYHVYAALDTNLDGKLDRNECVRMVQQLQSAVQTVGALPLRRDNPTFLGSISLDESVRSLQLSTTSRDPSPSRSKQLTPRYKVGVTGRTPHLDANCNTMQTAANNMIHTCSSDATDSIIHTHSSDATNNMIHSFSSDPTNSIVHTQISDCSVDDWVRTYNVPPLMRTPTIYYLGQKRITFQDLSPLLHQAISANEANFERMAPLVENGSLMATAWQKFKALDKDRKGVLEWNNGQIRSFINAVMRDHRLKLLSEREAYALYTRFDTDCNAYLNARECICLVDAIVRTIFYSGDGGSPQRFSQCLSPEAAFPNSRNCVLNMAIFLTRKGGCALLWAAFAIWRYAAAATSNRQNQIGACLHWAVRHDELCAFFLHWKWQMIRSDVERTMQQTTSCRQMQHCHSLHVVNYVRSQMQIAGRGNLFLLAFQSWRVWARWSRMLRSKRRGFPNVLQRLFERALCTIPVHCILAAWKMRSRSRRDGAREWKFAMRRKIHMSEAVRRHCFSSWKGVARHSRKLLAHRLHCDAWTHLMGAELCILAWRSWARLHSSARLATFAMFCLWKQHRLQEKAAENVGQLEAWISELCRDNQELKNSLDGKFKEIKSMTETLEGELQTKTELAAQLRQSHDVCRKLADIESNETSTSTSRLMCVLERSCSQRVRSQPRQCANISAPQSYQNSCVSERDSRQKASSQLREHAYMGSPRHHQSIYSLSQTPR